MNSVLYFAKLDMLSFKPYRKYLLMLPLAILAAFEPPLLGVQLLVFLMLTSLAPYLFASEDKNEMRRLYAILPIRVKDVVWGRYACCIIGDLLYILIMTILLSICTIYTQLSIISVVYSMLACTGFILLSIAVQFPIFFKVGFIRGKFAAVAPVFVLMTFVFASRQIIGIDFLSQISVFGGLSSFCILLIGISAVILSVSISVKLYQSREN